MATRKTAPTSPTPPTDEAPVTETTEPTARTRKSDPLLIAKRALERARAVEAKAQKRVDAHGDIIAALETAKTATAEAEDAFREAVEAALNA